MISRNKERRDQIFKIENYKKFNIETIKDIEKFYRRIYATYST